MKHLLLTLCVVIFLGGNLFPQINLIGNFNRADMNFTGPDSLKPFDNPGIAGNIGIRSVWIAEEDLDQDGKPELLITDYANKGRVHILELNGNVLEIVWSSPLNEVGGGSTPRWVRTGDLDGDGLGEIIFPNATSTTAAGEVRIRVFEWNGTTDNEYINVIDLAHDAFISQGVGSFRMSREVAEVYDFDGDGSDELIMHNRDNRTYILGISGSIPGFGGWQIEGGDPATVPKIGNGSYWHSVPADINGDGDIEIINHYWNYYGFWSIDPTGPDAYTFPDTSQSNHYREFYFPENTDAVGYMGIQPVDVDGDGNDELAGIVYVDFAGINPNNWEIALIDFSNTDDELYSWTQDKMGVIGENLWILSGRDTLNQDGNKNGSFWGIGAADLNGNGREEILIGGSVGYNIISLEYSGTGNLLDPNSYTKEILYADDFINNFSRLNIRDSSGTIDTVIAVLSESPFVSKIYAGSDINGNDKPEIALSYQSVFDSITYIYSHWGGTAFVDDSTIVVHNPDQITIRLLESTITGIKEYVYGIVGPDDYTLEQNYPNPFNPTTTIRFSLPLQKKISIKVYDILGNEVKTLIDNQDFEKGGYEVTWDGTNNSGSSVASGQYIYTLKYGSFSKSMKMTLLK